MGEVFKTTRKLRFADCDPAGIAFYPRLLEHVNGVVEDWCDGPLDYNFRKMHETHHRGLPTVALNVEFQRPARLGDRMDWQLTVKALNRSSMTLSIVASDPGGEHLLRAEPTQMFGDELSVQQAKAAGDQSGGEVDEGDLAGVALAREHALTEERPAETDAV